MALNLNLNEIIADSDFQKMQDEISVATNVAMITVDYSGAPLTAHSRCSAFCRKVRRDSEFSFLCEKCDSRGGVEAARLKRPFIYLCHMGLVDFAIPVISGGIYMGAVMAGQIILSDGKGNLERIVSVSNEKRLSAELIKDYERLPQMTYDRILALSNMIFYLVNAFIKDININKIKEINPLSDIKCSNKAKILLEPAIKYIESNYANKITLDKLSKMCRITGSYLSRLFVKAVGCNFTSYLNAVRIQRAKELLLSTNASVTSLALELGYEDAGYFIKVFKKYAGTTPNGYRNSNAEQAQI
jgi:ligand-binding sensor protein/AraC-like DNA-binding protein